MFSKEKRLGLRTWIEIDSEAIKHNYSLFRSLLPDTVKLMSVVKSNAYGHGLVDFSKTITGLGVDWLAVDSIVEGLRLREEGIVVPILVLGYTLPERIQEAVENNISITLSSMFAAQGIKDLNVKGKIKVHIKVDSGMHRQGFMEHERDELITVLKGNSENIEVEGMYTHFAAAKDPNDPKPTQSQLALFKKWIEIFNAQGFTPIKHAAATGETILFPETYFDMVRVGIGLHGLWPSTEAEQFAKQKINLKPSLTWKTIVSEMKVLAAGEKIGYDFTEETTRETTLAICPIGYWHGIPRSLSGIGKVLVNGGYAKIMGRVSMDMIAIDITDVSEVKVGDEVVIIGQSGELYQSAYEVAERAQNSTYEFVTRINPLIKKFYI